MARSSTPSNIANAANTAHASHSPYRRFCAAEWARLRRDMELTLTEEELAKLRGRGETVSLAEVEEIYLPLSRLLSFYAEAAHALYTKTNDFLGRDKKVPFIIGIAGSVAVGKSTSSRILQELLTRWTIGESIGESIGGKIEGQKGEPTIYPKVDLVTTDGFLYPTAVLEERALMNKKGFPESFDHRALRQFLSDVKAGNPCVRAPVYSHITYDIVADKYMTIESPDILIIEGLNVLQPAVLSQTGDDVSFVSDFFDFSIYIDAEADTIKEWYVARFLTLRDTAFTQDGAYFRRYADLSDEKAVAMAEDIWERINYANLRENILPTRGRADLILHKAADHSIDEVLLRKI